MKFSFLTYLFCRFPLEHSFQMAQYYGFDGIEIWGARPHAYAYDMDVAAVREILEMKKKYGVEISAYTPEILAYPYNLASPLKKEREETEEYLMRALETTAALEGQRMLLTLPHPGHLARKRDIWKLVLEPLRRLCARAEALGVTVVLETLTPSESNLVTTADEASALIEDVGSQAMTAMMDLVPPVIANEPVSNYFDFLQNRMDYIHLCNSDGVTEFHARLDEGVLPLQDVFTLLKRQKFEGWCSLEILAPYYKDPELYLAQSKRLIEAGISESEREYAAGNRCW